MAIISKTIRNQKNTPNTVSLSETCCSRASIVLLLVCSGGTAAAKKSAISMPTNKNGSQYAPAMVGPKGASQTPPAQLNSKMIRKKIKMPGQAPVLRNPNPKITLINKAITIAKIRCHKNIPSSYIKMIVSMG